MSAYYPCGVSDRTLDDAYGAVDEIETESWCRTCQRQTPGVDYLPSSGAPGWFECDVCGEPTDAAEYEDGVDERVDALLLERAEFEERGGAER